MTIQSNVQPPQNQMRYQSQVKKLHPLKRLLLKNRNSILVAGLIGFGFVLGSHEPASACAGFLCGPKEQLIAGLESAEGAADLINKAFLSVNFLVILIVALPTLVGMGKNVGRDEIGWYIATSVLFFVVMLGFNFIGDWVFGISGGGGGGAT